jgi:mannose-6-phosphate isomerase-like protein (cupin superfamily)
MNNGEKRPWGEYSSVDQGDGYQVKHIIVNPGGRLSLQRHQKRHEHWVVVGGEARVTVGDTVKTLKVNESVFIPLGEKHRLENPGKVILHLIEVQVGSYLGEDDIERFSDDYGRA